MKRHFLLIFSVFSGLSLIIGTGEAWSAGAAASVCQKPFLSLDVKPFPFVVNSDRVREIFADQENIIKYRGQKGYLLFAMKTPNSNRMDYIFNMVSKALGRDRFKKLHWQTFQGAAEEFRDIRDKILDAEGNVRKEYRTQEGYALFADRHYSGAMLKTFINVSAVLDDAQFQQTGWQAFHGSVEEFRDLKHKILDAEGKVRKEYRTMEGQALFAARHYNGAMFKTFQNVSAALGQKFQQTGWQQFKGAVEEFRDLRGKILDAEGKVRKEYRTMEGYALFAARHYNGAMFKTFHNVSAVLDKQEFKQTGWKSFKGAVKEFQDLSGNILDEKGNVRQEYRAMEGYARFAAEHNNGDMQKTFQNVSAALGQKFQQTGWQAFQGAVEEFQDLRDKILDAEGNVQKEYRTMEGQVLFADRHYSGDMRKTFLNVSTVLGGALAMRQWGLTEWKSFKGNTAQYRSLVQLFQPEMQDSPISSGETSLKKESQFDRMPFQGIEGQQKVADLIFDGDRRETYYNVSLLREPLLGSRPAFEKLQWFRNP